MPTDLRYDTLHCLKVANASLHQARHLEREQGHDFHVAAITQLLGHLLLLIEPESKPPARSPRIKTPTPTPTKEGESCSSNPPFSPKPPAP